MSAIAFDREGAGPPLLLIHGLGGERHVWEPLWPAFTARCDTMAVDLPGFGGTRALPEGADVSPPGLARAVAEHLAEQRFERPHVVGNSLGGWIALELARLGVVRSVTLLCPAGFWERKQGPLDPKRRRALMAARPLIPVLFAAPALRRRALGGVIAHPERLSYRAATRVASAYVGSRGYIAVQNAMRANRLEDDDGIDVPITLAWADEDRLVGPQRMPIHPRRIVTLRDAGHVPMWDVPDEIERLVLEDVFAGAA